MPATIYVYNEDPHYYSVQYFDNGDPARRYALQAQWQTFNRLDPATQRTHRIWVRPTNHISEVAVDYVMPPSSPPGRYRIETFVPGKHATTRRALFSIGSSVHPTERNEAHLDETIAIVDMLELLDVWQPLGEFYLDPSQHPHIGRVRQFDLSREEPPREISFGPVRWVPLLVPPGQGLRYDSPVGTEEERRAPFPTGRYIFGKYPIWTGDWFDANPFLTWYTYGIHTGADLNLPGVSAADQGKPIYAVADGLMTYAGKAGSWGNIIVIEHPEAVVSRPDGEVARQPAFSRYGHVDDQILARAGEMVTRGQHIGYIGLAWGAKSGWHLHFDVSYSDIFKSRPAFWPDITGMRTRPSDDYSRIRASIQREVLRHFVAPLKFIQENHSNSGN